MTDAAALAATLSFGMAKSYMVEASTFVGDLYKPPRGRWVAVCMVTQPDGTKQMRGARCTSKAKARAIANQYGGVVRHYRAKNWRPPPPPKVQVHTWVKKWDGPTFAADKAVVDAG